MAPFFVTDSASAIRHSQRLERVRVAASVSVGSNDRDSISPLTASGNASAYAAILGAAAVRVAIVTVSAGR